jgi:serine/threonine protein phosphatase PrpC
MTLITPLEPGSARGRRSAGQQSVQAMTFGRVAAAVASSRGSGHAVNEDAHTALGRRAQMFVVADGVGGGAMASMASRELVAQLHAGLESAHIDPDSVREAMLAADRVIAESIAELTDAPGAATVALCAPVNAFASRWLVAWVGDCRVYRVCADPAAALHALTHDDSFAQLKETPPPGSSPDDPARMVGNGAVVSPNVAFTELRRGEMLLMCSDGVHKHVSPEELGRLPEGVTAMVRRCEELIALARAGGSTDDATVLLLQRTGLAMPRPRWMMGRADGDGAVR